MRYLPRIVDAELSDRLRGAGAFVLEGPRGCGKTWTARRLSASEALLDTDANARRMVEVDVPGGGGYRMENGVCVVPIAALGP